MKIDIKKYESEYDARSSQCSLFYKRYFTDSNTKKTQDCFNIFIFHDIGEHGGRYDGFIEDLINHLSTPSLQIICHTIDYPGHGKSSGQRGHLKNLKKLSEDLISFINTQVSNKSQKTILLGHGLGSLLICNMLHNHGKFIEADIKGSILLNPSFKLKKKINPLVNILANQNYLNSNIKIDLESSQERREKGISEINDQDPLFCHSITIKTFRALEELGKSLRTSSYYFEIPFFMGVNSNHFAYDETLSELYCKGLEKGLFKKYFHAPHYTQGHHIGPNALKDIIKWFQNQII